MSIIENIQDLALGRAIHIDECLINKEEKILIYLLDDTLGHDSQFYLGSETTPFQPLNFKESQLALSLVDIAPIKAIRGISESPG